MEALHENGTIIKVAKAREYDLVTLVLMADCGYTHVRTPSWAWEEIAVAIDSARAGERRPFNARAMLEAL
jgi:hypothetical protein